MSANLCFMAWNDPMGTPNWRRTLAYSRAMSKMLWHVPIVSMATAAVASSTARLRARLARARLPDDGYELGDGRGEGPGGDHPPQLLQHHGQLDVAQTQPTGVGGHGQGLPVEGHHLLPQGPDRRPLLDHVPHQADGAVPLQHRAHAGPEGLLIVGELEVHGLASPQPQPGPAWAAASARSRSRRANFCTLPDGVRGSSSTRRSSSGHLG